MRSDLCLCVRTYACICMCCMHVYIHVCVHACIHVCMYLCVNACLCACMYACTGMYACIYACVCSESICQVSWFYDMFDKEYLVCVQLSVVLSCLRFIYFNSLTRLRFGMLALKRTGTAASHCGEFNLAGSRCLRSTLVAAPVLFLPHCVVSEGMLSEYAFVCLC